MQRTVVEQKKQPARQVRQPLTLPALPREDGYPCPNPTCGKRLGHQYRDQGGLPYLLLVERAGDPYTVQGREEVRVMCPHCEVEVWWRPRRKPWQLLPPVRVLLGEQHCPHCQRVVGRNFAEGQLHGIIVADEKPYPLAGPAPFKIRCPHPCCKRQFEWDPAAVVVFHDPAGP